MRRRADEGSAVNQCALGLCYLYGVDVAIDYAEAFGLLMSAQRGNLPRASLHLGFMYAEGWGTSRNLPEAIALFEAVARADSGADGFEAALALGRLYATVVPDVAGALQWYAAAIPMAPAKDSGDDVREAEAYLARHRRNG